MRDWELVDSDRFSFDDSDRFEEDSLCSWISEPESLCNNWRGWKKSIFPIITPNPNVSSTGSPGVSQVGEATTSLGPKKSSNSDFSTSYSSATTPSHLNLVELASKRVALHIPFEIVESFYPPVPEQLQLRIAFWSFPQHEDDIRLYSTLANGSAEEFQKGEKLSKSDSVSDILQIGFHLSATVKPNLREAHKVAVTFDRRKVTSCTCTCNASTKWCCHVVAVCLRRIFQSKDVMLRAPVSESLSGLDRDQLQKFSQHLINELPQQYLSTVQRILDELLSSKRSDINTQHGAPDPTAGASANEHTTWFLDERTLHGNIHKILIKFCVPAPIVFSDVNYLSSAAPPASAEWSSLLRPLRGREPEGMWNLLSIVRELFRRKDRNAVPLLEVITEECLNCDQILVWWFNTKVALHNGNSGHGGKHHSVNSNAHACQHAGSSLCDEIVSLWRLAALNPGLSPDERTILRTQFKEWHMKIIEKISKSRNASVGSKHANSFKNDIEIFPGFRPSIEACYLSWDSYPIPGVTYSEAKQMYHCPFMYFRHTDGHSRSGETGQIHSSHAILNNPTGEHHLLHSSATISSVPMLSKRPRSVEFGGDREAGPSSKVVNGVCGGLTLAPVAGPSTSKGGKSGRSSAKKQQHRFELAALDGMLPLSASGLKIKSHGKELRPLASDGSFDVDDILAPTSSSSSGRSRVGPIEGGAGTLEGAAAIVPLPISSRNRQKQQLLLQRRASVDGNRSSVSSEGFCENENFNEPENPADKDEGVERDIGELVEVNSKLLKQMNLTTTSDEFECETEGYLDMDNDSDSSISTRVREVDLQKLVSIAPDLVAPSKFDSASDSQQSGDEYQLYYYDPNASTADRGKKRGSDGGSTGEESNSKKDPTGLSIFTNIKKIEDSWEILFARAEGLHAHGHSKEACKLGVKLAQELLANPPDLTLDLPPVATGKGKRKKINPASHQISCLASDTLAKCGFLCTVLAENSEYYYLAFQVGMFGLELARPPASTKPLEVKLANQEAELAQLLKRIPIDQKELDIIREKAESLKAGTFRSRGESLLPLVLANFVFDALAMPANTMNREGRCTLQEGVYHLPTDESLGFEAAVAALGLKANVSEAEHPLLCEGTRRQRGDLALTMLLHYKDDSEKLAKVMDKLLDREIHQLYKAPLPAAYYSNNPPTTTLLGPWTRNEETNPANNESPPPPAVAASFTPPAGSNRSSPLSSGILETTARSSTNVASASAKVESPTQTTAPPLNGSGTTTPVATTPSTTNATTPPASAAAAASSATPANPTASRSGGKESGRFKGKRSYPVLPNQPSEAGAHFMFELAKVVLGKAGGSSNQSLFTQPSNGQNPRGPHRALHMCAFHIGLYALGLHNAVSPNWLSRTYSSHVSWITGQVMEIGAPAIAFLIDTWDSHLTPPEAVTIADRASRGDVNMVRAASELALSCLPFAHALNPNELHRAILQCKEQSDGMLEKACVTVESAAKGGGVYPEVLFDVARQWFSLYQKHLPLDVDILNEEFVHHDGFLIMDSSVDPMNPNNHHQMISAQTGLPPVNPNNPPSLPPSSGSGGPGSQIEMIQMPPQGPPHMPHQALYPMSTPQVPMGIPFAAAGYGPPFMQAGFNPVPMAMYPQVIYQANAVNNPNGVPSASSGYYNQHSNAQQQNPPPYPPPSMHPIHSHHHHPNLASAGPSLQYYNPSSNGIQVPITTSGGPHLRQPQFFPMNHMNIHGHNSHNHSMNGGMNMNPNGQCNPAPSHSHLSVVPSGSSGGSGHPNHHGHFVAIPSGNPNQNQGMQGMMLQPPPHSNGLVGHQGHSMNHGRGPNVQHHGQQMNSMMNHHNGFGNYPMGSMGNNGMNCLPLMDGPPPNSPPQNARENMSSKQATGHSAVKVKYLLASYRVGMLAMETLARRVHDDRPAAKFARNPPYGEDVKWLLSVSRKLGAQYVQQFCICAVSSIANPFVLHEIILDAAFISTRTSLSYVYQNQRSPLAPLVQKCQQMYFQCLHQKLFRITLSEYDDFVSIVCTAKQAFHLTQDGVSQFKEWLQNLKKSKQCKKDLWIQITNALQSNPK